MNRKASSTAGGKCRGARAALAAWAGVLAVVVGPGCGGSADPALLSPSPDQDPARHARAVVEMEETVRRNQEAEARFMRRVAARPAFRTARVHQFPADRSQLAGSHTTLETP